MMRLAEGRTGGLEMTDELTAKEKKLKGLIAKRVASSHGYVFPCGIEEEDNSFLFWADQILAPIKLEIAAARKDGYEQAKAEDCQTASELREEGMQKVVEWVEHNQIFIALEFDGTPGMALRNNQKKIAERWQAQLKRWGIEK